MIRTVPIAELGPAEYRYALDVAAALLSEYGQLRVRCSIPQIMPELAQRGLAQEDKPSADAGLWVEPLQPDWAADLAKLAQLLPAGAPLIIIAASPLARLIPERRGWSGQPLGYNPLGLGQLRRAMRGCGFRREREIWVHSLLSIGLNSLSANVARFGRPEIADRLYFAARSRYAQRYIPGTLSLIIARKSPSDAKRNANDGHRHRYGYHAARCVAGYDAGTEGIWWPSSTLVAAKPALYRCRPRLAV